MIVNFMRQSLILALQSGNKFVVLKRLSVFQKRGPSDDIINLVTLKKYLAL